jgi:hypothetical protein
MKFIEILNEYNIPTAPKEHHHNTQGWIQFDCPFCSKDSHRWRMGYNIRGGFVNCWSCGGHSLFSTLRVLLNESSLKIKSIIDSLEGTRPHPVKRENIRKFKYPDGIGDLIDAHVRYLSNRGLHYKTIEQLWHVQGIGIANRLMWRLFIPILYQNRVVSWTTRAIGDKVKKRYISASEEEELIPHKSILYGSDYARKTIIICEGPIDVWKIGPGAVATFGTAYSQAQVLEMIKYPIRYICFDSVPEAQKVAKKLAEELSVFDGETYNICLDSKDAGAASIKEIKKLRNLL